MLRKRVRVCTTPEVVMLGRCGRPWQQGVQCTTEIENKLDRIAKLSEV